jgi:hypothetical protein
MMNPSTYGLDSETVRVDHVFTLNVSDKWDKPLRRLAESGMDIGYHFAESFRFIAIGISAYFVLFGTAKLIEACRNKKSRDESSSESSSSNKSSSRPISRSSSQSESPKSKSSSKDHKSSKEKSPKPRSPKSDSKEDASNTASKDEPKTDTKE